MARLLRINNFAGIVKILEVPKQRLFTFTKPKKGRNNTMLMTEFRASLTQRRKNSQIVHLIIWGELSNSYRFSKYLKPNDYILIEGQLTGRYIEKKKLQITVRKSYPILMS